MTANNTLSVWNWHIVLEAIPLNCVQNIMPVDSSGSRNSAIFSANGVSIKFPLRNLTKYAVSSHTPLLACQIGSLKMYENVTVGNFYQR